MENFMEVCLSSPLKVCPIKREPCEYYSGEGCYLSGKWQDIVVVQCEKDPC
jgi:hypothetical protein